MKRSLELEIALNDVRQQYRAIEAPAHILARLRATAEARRPSARRPRMVFALALAVIVLVVVWRVPKPQAARSEPVTAFVAIPGSDALPQPMATSVLRVQLLSVELQQFGLRFALPVGADTIQADFLIGDDGLARGVRVVR